jgi:hypothetical protein
MKRKTICTMALMSVILLSAGNLYAKKRADKRADKRAGKMGHERHENFMEKEQEFLEYIQEYMPYEYDDVVELKEKNPVEYHKKLKDGMHRMHYMKQLKEDDPDAHDRIIKMAKLEQQSLRLSKQYRKEENAGKKEGIKAELLQILDSIFNIRQENKEKEVKRLELKLEELKTTLKKRKDVKQEIIQNRLNKLIGKSDHLEW